MFSRTVLVCIGATLAGVAAGCGSSDATAPARTQVVAAFYPLAYAAEQVAGRAVDVTNLTPSGAEPHDIELSPRDVERIDDADVVLYVGSGFMPQVEDAVARLGNGLDVLTEVETISGPSGVDPHVWLDPLRYASVVRRIAGELGDPAAGARLSARLELLELAGRHRFALIGTESGRPPRSPVSFPCPLFSRAACSDPATASGSPLS